MRSSTFAPWTTEFAAVLLLVTLVPRGEAQEKPAPASAPRALPRDGQGRIVYQEDFHRNSGGWMADKFRPLVVNEGIAYCWGDPAKGPVYAPWSIDFWHAPPGGGYLFMLLWIHTHRVPRAGYYPGYPGNRYVAEGYPTDFTNAEVTVRLRGQIELRGAQLHFWVQAQRGDVTPNYLMREPVPVTRDWSQYTLRLVPDDAAWRCMGGRHDRPDYAGGCRCNIADVLRDVNADILFVLFPLKIVPIKPMSEEEMHHRRAGWEYEVDPKVLPKGVIEFDWVKIAFTPGVGGSKEQEQTGRSPSRPKPVP